jgi:peptidoglycan/xylan/chitin deacetylase (PgdA/CDA1 family)
MHRTTQTEISRRDFLKWGGAALLSVTMQPWGSPKGAQEIPAPPIFMLHSRHRGLLPRLLDALIGEGYQGITFLDLEQALSGRLELPPQPILITIDDLELARGEPGFEAFTAMKDALVERQFKGVFALITAPQAQQNDDWWAEIATWPAQGIEFATHTAYHSNLDNPTFTADDYYEEIVVSARVIRARAASPVTALVTPYGSGYDYAADSIRPGVLQACQEAHLRFVVGIVGGRVPIPLNPPPDAVIYLGRMPPGIDGTVDSSLYELHHWKAS